MADAGLEREAHPVGHVGRSAASAQLLVRAQVLAVGGELGGGQRRRVGAEEELEQPRVAELVEVGASARARQRVERVAAAPR